MHTPPPDLLRRFSRDQLNAQAGQRFISHDRQYQLEGKISDGAIGVVRKARDLSSGELVAIKFLAPEFRYIEASGILDLHARFRREGLRGEGLEHENLVKIISYEENENTENFESHIGPCNPFLIMEFIRGRTLESFIHHQRTYPMANITLQTLYIASQICRGLLYLHDRNVIHRDVKPANIFLSTITPQQRPAIVKLGDFGVVRWGDFRASITTGTLTTTGQQGLGTIKYMPPEQALDATNVTVRSDMFSLGVTLYEMFTGQILPSHHHVFQIMQVRMMRTTIYQKLHDLGLGEDAVEFADLFANIFDMFLTGQKGRPSSRQMNGRLQFLLERVEKWQRGPGDDYGVLPGG